MVGGVAFDGFSEQAEVGLCLCFFGPLDMALKLGKNNSRQYAQYGRDNHQLDQRKAPRPVLPVCILLAHC